MRISGFDWDEGNVVHLALGHGIEAEEMSMPRRPSRAQQDLPKDYDRRRVLQEIEERPVEFALDEELRRAILKGQRARRLQNLSIKLDAAQIHALRKIATMKAIPYQTLIRQWLAEGIRRELRLGHS